MSGNAVTHRLGEVMNKGPAIQRPLVAKVNEIVIGIGALQDIYRPHRPRQIEPGSLSRRVEPALPAV